MYKTLIEKHFQPFIETIKPPALVAGLMKEGKLVETFSHSTSQCALPPEQWLFRIASMTKCFTAAAALLLRDQGKLQLSDRVIDYLPQLKNHASFSEITIYQLLTMQCGLPTDDPWADRYLGCTVSEFDQILSGNFSFVATAGTEYHYSNLGYMILGRVLSKAADVSILKFISDHILNPLEMKDTVWNTESLGRQLGFCYDQDKLKAETGFVVKDDSAVFAGLWSSVADLSKWIAFLLDADHHMTSEFESILSATSRRELQSSMVYAPPRDSSLLSNEYVHYGFGLRQFVKDSYCFYGHSGGLPGYGSHFRWSREKSYAVIACSNLTYCPVWDPCRELMREVSDKTQVAMKKNSEVQQRGELLVGLILNWNEQDATQLFAYNLFQDSPREFLLQKFDLLKTRYPNLSDKYTICQERGLGGKLMLEDLPLLLFTLAPVADSKIQEIKFLI